ncbi:uncharacterized protein METZ01_LOCUS504511, partial [marine metagenome]
MGQAGEGNRFRSAFQRLGLLAWGYATARAVSDPRPVKRCRRSPYAARFTKRYLGSQVSPDTILVDTGYSARSFFFADLDEGDGRVRHRAGQLDYMVIHVITRLPMGGATQLVYDITQRMHASGQDVLILTGLSDEQRSFSAKNNRILEQVYAA